MNAVHLPPTHICPSKYVTIIPTRGAYRAPLNPHAGFKGLLLMDREETRGQWRG